MAVKRHTGAEAMAEDLADAAELNRQVSRVALQAFFEGWSAVRESMAELDEAA
jgi:hypothetical protein